MATFHYKHGHNVTINENRTLATGGEAYCPTVVFSADQMKIGEITKLKVEDKGESGFICIGLTAQDPVRYKGKGIHEIPLTWYINTDGEMYQDGSWTKGVCPPWHVTTGDNVSLGWSPQTVTVYKNTEIIHCSDIHVEYTGKAWMVAVLDWQMKLRISDPDKVPSPLPAVKHAGLELKAKSKGDEHVFDIARKVVAGLNIPSGYFENKFDVCFCTKCHTSRGDNLKYPRGKPPVFYGLPIGWCKFGLRTKPQAVVQNVFQDWHVAFHGTVIHNISKILETGDLLLPGDYNPIGNELKIPKNHWDPKNRKMKPPAGHDVSKFYFSPSITYAGCEVYAKQSGWTDQDSGEKHRIRVAFQVRIKPGSYDVTKQTIGARRELDPLFPNSELEWSTKRRGVAILVGLLVKVEGLEADPDLEMMKELMSAEQGESQEATGSGVPAKLLHTYVHKTQKGKTIELEKGDKCRLLQEEEEICTILHPYVNEPVKLPPHYVRKI